MINVINLHSILYSSPYGFRQGYSTQHAIIDIVEHVLLKIYQVLRCYYR